MGFFANQWDRIGKRLSVSRLHTDKLSDDASAHIEVIKDDMYHNLQEALTKDGHTGKLGTPDGILKGRPQVYKGFFVQCFGMVVYQSDLDVFGKMYWQGFAKKKIKTKGKEATIRFETDQVQKLGFETERECGNWLFKMIDLYQEHSNN